MKTTEQERKNAKAFIEHLEKMNKEGRLKILETDMKPDIRDGILDGGNKVTPDTVKGSFIDVAYYVYS